MTMQECAEVTARVDPIVHAWETFSPDPMPNDRDGPLKGVPVGVKDIFNTADFPTQMGSPIWKDFTPGNDARAVYNLRRAGAIIPGKTVTAEFAVHALGNTLNPHDKKRNPGTSSSGSAVAVATGMVPMALATQTAGSIVRPASYCGVYGCKPSFGTIPRTGVLKTADTLDTIGFFVSEAKDLRTLFNVLRVHGRNYPYVHATLDRPRDKKTEFKIGLIADNMNVELYAEAFLRGVIWDKIGIDTVHLYRCPYKTDPHEVHATIYDKSLSHYFRKEYKRHELVSDVMNGIIERGQRITLDQYKVALLKQAEIIKEMDDLFESEKLDVLVSLSTAGIAPLRDEPEPPDTALIWTLAHLPVVSVPLFTGPGGMPYGLQVIGRQYDDYTVFDFVDHMIERGVFPAGSNPKWREANA